MTMRSVFLFFPYDTAESLYYAYCTQAVRAHAVPVRYLLKLYVPKLYRIHLRTVPYLRTVSHPSQQAVR